MAEEWGRCRINDCCSSTMLLKLVCRPGSCPCRTCHRNHGGNRQRVAELYGNHPLEVVQEYLPSNYLARMGDNPHQVLIEGYDFAGWTLTYVIERLASGLRIAKEVKVDIYTYTEAIHRMETAMEDIDADDRHAAAGPGPHRRTSDVDIHHAAATCVISGGAGSIDPTIAVMLAERELGWNVVDDRELFKQHGLEV